MQVKTQMKRKVGKDPEGGIKKRKEVGNESPLSSKFQKQQTVNDLNKSRETYNVILEKGKELGLDEAVLVDPVTRSKDTHDIEGTETSMQQFQNTVWTQSVSQSLSFQTLLVTRVYTLLTPQPFRDSITTVSPTTKTVRFQKSHKKTWSGQGCQDFSIPEQTEDYSVLGYVH